LVLQARFHSVCCHPQNPLDVGKPCGRQVIEIPEPMFEVLTSRGILNSESDLLQRHAPVIVRSQYVKCTLSASVDTQNRPLIDT
jgi:hypothetical protein